MNEILRVVVISAVTVSGGFVLGVIFLSGMLNPREQLLAIYMIFVAIVIVLSIYQIHKNS